MFYHITIYFFTEIPSSGSSSTIDAPFTSSILILVIDSFSKCFILKGESRVDASLYELCKVLSFFHNYKTVFLFKKYRFLDERIFQGRDEWDALTSITNFLFKSKFIYFAIISKRFSINRQTQQSSRLMINVSLYV